MDNSFRQQKSETRQSNGFFVNLQVLGGLLHWLAGLFQLTEEEQEDAGIFPDDIHDK